MLQRFIGVLAQFFNGGGQVRIDLVNRFLQRAVCIFQSLLQIGKLSGQGFDIRFQEGIRTGIGVRQVGDGLRQRFIGGIAQVFDGVGQILSDLVNGFLQRFVRFIHLSFQIGEVSVDFRLQQSIRVGIGSRQIADGFRQILGSRLAQVIDCLGQILSDLVNGFLQRVVRFFHSFFQSFLRGFQIFIHLRFQRLVGCLISCDQLGQLRLKVAALLLKRFVKGLNLILQILDQFFDLLGAHGKQAIHLVGGHTSHASGASRRRVFAIRDDRKRSARRVIPADINGNRAVRIGRRIGTSPNISVMQVVIRIEMCNFHPSRICSRSRKGQDDLAV